MSDIIFLCRLETSKVMNDECRVNSEAFIAYLPHYLSQILVLLMEIKTTGCWGVALLIHDAMVEDLKILDLSYSEYRNFRTF